MPTRTQRELQTINAMISLFCQKHHFVSDGELCGECKTLLQYAQKRLDKCPFQNIKPTCGKCSIHCYNKEMKERVKEVMSYAGPRMIWVHPVMAIQHLIDNFRSSRLNSSRIQSSTKSHSK